jgi:hypothetical protein
MILVQKFESPPRKLKAATTPAAPKRIARIPPLSTPSGQVSISTCKQSNYRHHSFSTTLFSGWELYLS